MLENKVIVIAGAAGRIGRALALEVCESGAFAILADIDIKKVEELALKINKKIKAKNTPFYEEDEAKKSKAKARLALLKKGKIIKAKDFKEEEFIYEKPKLNNKSKPAFAFFLDCSSEQSLASLILEAKKRFGRISAFVNTSYPYGKLEPACGYLNSSYAQINDLLNAHLASYILAAQSFARYFVEEGGGNIINLSSIMGVFAPNFKNYEGTKMLSPLEYSVIKAGINHLSKFLAKLLFNTGVRVNALAAGGIEDGQAKPFLKAYKAQCASKGMLKPKDLCPLLLFLLSDESRYITGEVFVIDDGWGL